MRAKSTSVSWCNWPRLAAVLLAFISVGCGESTETVQGPHYGNEARSGDIPRYRFAVHPLFNPRKLTEAYQPLIDYLNRKVPNARFQLEASRDYAAYEEKFRAREAEFLLPNPWQTLQAMKVGYGVIAQAGDPEDFKGIFIVRKDGGIKQPSDLKGKRVSYPSPTALAAAIMPQHYLHVHGVDVLRDLDNRYVGSQESSIMSVYLKDVTAGATWPPPWRAFQKDHPVEAEQLMVIWETDSLVNNSVMVRDDVPAEVRARVAELLAGLDKSGEGRAVLAASETKHFRAANDETYAAARKFIEHFEREVRPVEGQK